MTDDERAALVSDIAHQITGCNGSVCCHKTGGRGGQYMRPGCECRETATAILAAIEPVIRADERERCARIVETPIETCCQRPGEECCCNPHLYWLNPGEAADAIRALKDKPS